MESEYSQEKLAELLAKRWDKEVSAEWAGKHLRFGRFLTFFSTSGTEDSRLPPDLTEGKFRALWEQTQAGGNFSGHKANTEAAKQDELTATGFTSPAFAETTDAAR